MLAVRVDDIGWTSESSSRPPLKLSDEGLQIARDFHEAMSGVPYLAGVIPAYVDPPGWKWLKSLSEHEITLALHGFDHGTKRPNERDEFSGLTSKQVRDAIEMGQKRLPRPTRHFIPPYNAMPPRLTDLHQEGIQYLWVAPRSWDTPPAPYESGPLWIIPAWSHLYGATRWAQAKGDPIVNERIRDHPLLAPAVVTLHITWEHARDPQFHGVREFARLIRDRAVTPDEFVRATCRR